MFALLAYLSQRSDLAEELRAEVKSMMQVHGHPHVVSLKGVYEDEDAVHLCMELCKGGDLYDMLTSSVTLPEPVAAHLAK